MSLNVRYTSYHDDKKIANTGNDVMCRRVFCTVRTTSDRRQTAFNVCLRARSM